MPSSTLKAATAFLMLLPCAFSMPAKLDLSKVRRQDAKSGIPWYCDPGEPYDYNNMDYSDQSEVCSAQGIAETCCVVFTSGGTCNFDFDSTAVSDLESAVGQQIQKSGQFEITDVGLWDVGYGVLEDSQPSPNILTEWFAGLSDLVNDPDVIAHQGGSSTVFFFAYNLAGSDGGVEIVASPDCLRL